MLSVLVIGFVITITLLALIWGKVSLLWDYQSFLTDLIIDYNT